MPLLDRLRRSVPYVPDSLPAVREQRAPTAATQALQWVSPGQPMVAQWDAANAVRWAFYANVIVYRCVQLRANTIASLPFLAGRNPGQPSDHDPNARLAQLLGPAPGGPAPKLSARRLWAWTVAQRIVTGKYGWEIERTPQGEVAALWPLVSAELREVPSTGGSEWFRAFQYGPPHEPRTLRPDRIVYGWRPALNDFRQAESELQAARLDVSVAVMMDRYNYGFLRNDARPAAVVVHQAFADDDEYQAWKEQFLGEHQGPENAGKVAFSETEGDDATKALHIEVLGLSHKDAQFLEQHQKSLERIALALGVPWSMLDASGRTFDNASEEAEHFWVNTMLPDLTDLQDEINMQLAPLVGREVGWFDLSGVKALQPTRRVQEVGAPALITGGVATVNEARQFVGLPPVEGGDVLVDSVGLAMAQANATTEAAPVPAPEPLAEVEPPPPEEPEEPARAVAPAETRALTAEEMELRRARIWRRADATVRTLESRWERAFRRLFRRQADATIARLEGKRGRQLLERDERQPVDPIFDPAFWADETREISDELYELVVAAGGGRVSELFGVAFDLADEWAADFVQARSNQLAGPVTDTTYRQIQEALEAGIAEGEGIPELSRRVRHVFDVATSQRATVIARTEVISAYNGSATTFAATLPADVVAGQEWIATRDGRTRDAHAAADGQVVPIGAPFHVGGDALLYPGDPSGAAGNTIQCRCTTAFLTPAELADRTAVVERRVSALLAAAVLAMVRPGGPLDELALRRALRQEAAA